MKAGARFVLTVYSVASYVARGRCGALASEPPSLPGYGCKFVPSLCSPDEVCVDDNLFGACGDWREGGLSRRWYTVDDELREILEAVLTELIRGGYSWRDGFAQCTIDEALRGYRQRTVFRSGVCGAFVLGEGSHDTEFADASATLLSNQDFRDDAATNGKLVQLLASESMSSLNMRDIEMLQSLLRMTDDRSRNGDAGRGPHDVAEQKLLGGYGFSTSPKLLHDGVSRAEARSTLWDAAPARVAEAGPLMKNEVNREALVAKLLTNELAADQLSPEEAKDLIAYIHVALSESPTKPTSKVAASRPTSSSLLSLDSIRLAVTAESMAESSNITNAAADPEKSSDSDTQIVRAEPSTQWDVDPVLHAAVVTAGSPVLHAAVVAAGSREGMVEESEPGTLLGGTGARADAQGYHGNSTYSNVSQSENYAWMILKSSVSLENAHVLAATLENLLSTNNVTVVTEVRVDHNMIVVTAQPGTDRSELDNLIKFVADHKEIIESDLGITIVETGVGSSLASIYGQQGHSSMDAVPVEIAKTRRQMFIVVFVLCGAAVGIGGALVFICVVRRCQRRSDRRWRMDKDCHHGTDDADEETGCLTQDYEDLIRQHIHSKTSEQSDSPPGSIGAGAACGGDEAECGQRSARSSQSSWSEEPAICSMDVSTGHMILSYMEDHLKNKDRLEEEWQSLCSYQADLSSMDVALLSKNKRKNRYPSVLPYDHNRVVLDERRNVSGEDYINASLVADHDPRSATYIATQGPLAQSVADFWQMVWEKGAVVMAVLTKLNEHGSTMCHRYWPNGSSELYHVYEVHLVSEHVWCDDYLVRSFYLKNLETNETRTVTQFHFLAWPDGGVPASTKSLLDFRRKMNKSYRGRSCPIIVVCSDGAGRSGAFMLLDMAINRLCKGAKEIDIAATLEHIRDQRMSAVQTKEQFEFVLSAIAEEVQAMLLPA